jgi:hypothetical protein
VSGLVALGWQIITWRASGPMISVKVTQGILTYGASVGDMVTIVTAINRGRAPVTVRTWGLRLPDGQTMFVPEPVPGSNAIPYRLDQGSSADWRVPTAVVDSACRARGVSHTMLRGYVALGTGRDVVARKRGIQLAADFDVALANSKADVHLPN